MSLLHVESFPAQLAGWILSSALDQFSGRGSTGGNLFSSPLSNLFQNGDPGRLPTVQETLGTARNVATFGLANITDAAFDYWSGNINADQLMQRAGVTPIIQLGLASSFPSEAATPLEPGLNNAAQGGTNILGQSFGKLGTVVEHPGQTITGFTYHGFNNAATRGLTWDIMQSTVQQPSVVLRQSAGQNLYVSPNSAVILNPAGEIMTTYPSSMFDPGIQAVLKAANGGN